MTKKRGFTLVELMITLAVSAIIVTVAVPSFASFIRSQRASTQANDLLVSLTFARSEALKRGVPISVCSTDDAAASPPSCTLPPNNSQYPESGAIPSGPTLKE